MRIERTGLVHGTVHQRDLDVRMLAEERKQAKPCEMTKATKKKRCTRKFAKTAFQVEYT